MIDLLILSFIGLIVGLAVHYIRKSKKAGKTCIGCPYGGSCSGRCAGK